MAVIFLLAGLVVLSLSASFYEIRHFKIKEYSLKSDKIKGERIIIAFLTDLHSCSYGKNNGKLIEAITEANPDIVLIGGDIYTAVEKQDNSAAENFLRDISGKYPIYYALGNHEYRFFNNPDRFPGCYARFLELIKACKIHLLDNDTCSVRIKGNRIDLYGLTIGKEYYKHFKALELTTDDIEKRLHHVQKDAFSILLAHNPAFFEAYAKWMPDLILSGHYHGGIVRFKNRGVISPSYRLFPKYSYGLMRGKQSDMIVSGGLGQHTIPIRLFNPPELVMINISKND